MRLFWSYGREADPARQRTGSGQPKAGTDTLNTETFPLLYL